MPVKGNDTRCKPSVKPIYLRPLVSYPSGRVHSDTQFSVRCAIRHVLNFAIVQSVSLDCPHVLRVRERPRR